MKGSIGKSLFLLVTLGLLGSYAEAQKPSVLFVTIDTLRADRVGGEPSLTPSLDSLGADGIRFQRAMAQVPITLPSHISILTGTYPMYHGIRDFGGFKLDPKRETLAELLLAQGYNTAAFVSSFALDSQWGLDQGFLVYHDQFDLSNYAGIGFNAVERKGNETVDLALEWIKSNGDRPFFLWVHLFDPHDPYEPPEPYRSRFKSQPYDGEVAFADLQLGRLLSALKDADRYDPSLIVVMGDHGEGLGEHGEETHGFFVYNTTLHIPLVVKLPGNHSAGRTVREVVQSIDVAPTVLQSLRLRRGEEMQGRGLLGLLRPERASGSTPGYGESYYARYHFGWSSLSSYQDENYKYIRAPRRELYDLRKDPGELENLYSSQRALGDQFDNLMVSLVQKYQDETPQETDLTDVDEETRQRLQSLGYISISSSRTAAGDDRDRADPKDKIGVFSAVRTATIETEKGNIQSSIERLAKVIEEDPKIYTARYLQGFNFFKTAQYLRSVEEFKAALELFPDSPEAVHSLAMSYLRLGIDGAAQTGFERLLQLRPDSPDAYIGLGGLALKSRNTQEAKERFQRALELSDSSEAHLGLGKVLVAEGEFDAGIKELESVVAVWPNSVEAHMALGYAYQKTGQGGKAAQHLQRARDSQNLGRR